MLRPMAIRIRFLKSYGTFAVYLGNRNLGSNFMTADEAIKWAKTTYPKTPVTVA